MDNAGEFISQSFNDYCMSIGIMLEHSVSHTHTHNGLAKSLIKKTTNDCYTFTYEDNLPTSAWGHAILHVASLVRLRPTSSS